MALQAGRLRHRVRIQEKSVTQNAYGEEAPTWAAITNGERWAAVEPLSGSERFGAQQVNPRVSHKVTIRYLSTVTPKMRVLFGSRALEIDAVINPMERGEVTELLCTENPDAEA